MKFVIQIFSLEFFPEQSRSLDIIPDKNLSDRGGKKSLTWIFIEKRGSLKFHKWKLYFFASNVR